MTVKRDRVEEVLQREVDGYGGRYVIYSDGRVYSNYKKRFLVPQLNDKGYWRLDLGEKKHLIHRLIAQAFIPNPSNHSIINHINGNKKDNRIENLEWCTYSHNKRHSLAMYGTDAFKGERNGNSKLTANQVLEMREIYAGNPSITFSELGRKYNVQSEHVAAIIRHKKWGHPVSSDDHSPSTNYKEGGV